MLFSLQWKSLRMQNDLDREDINSSWLPSTTTMARNVSDFNRGNALAKRVRGHRIFLCDLFDPFDLFLRQAIILGQRDFRLQPKLRFPIATVDMYMHARLFPRKKEILACERPLVHDDRIRAWNNRNELLVAVPVTIAGRITCAGCGRGSFPRMVRGCLRVFATFRQAFPRPTDRCGRSRSR
jgi:hypothetical protein